MKYNWVIRMLQEIEQDLKAVEHISAINYAIGYLIGIGWADK